MTTPSPSVVRVAVADDSSFIRRALARMLAEEPRIEVVGTAASGEALLAHLEDWSPDVVTLDLEMPGMGGLATLDHLRVRAPLVPVIILSTHSGAGAPQTIEALHRGAVDFIDKQQYSLVDFASLRQVLCARIFQVTGILPEAESFELAPTGDESSTEMPSLAGWANEPQTERRWALVVIGASTGGPPAIQQVLEDLGEAAPAPVVIVQHMPAGFTGAFAERLNAHLPLEVRRAVHGDRPVPGSVLIAPAGQHLRVLRDANGLVLTLSDEPRTLLHTPSVDVLFRSAARTIGRRTIGVLLTGMGSDGAKGLSRLHDLGARTCVQDEASSVVYGMPRAALNLDAADDVVELESMGGFIRALLDETTESPPEDIRRWNRRENM